VPQSHRVTVPTHQWQDRSKEDPAEEHS
jgi:hypothetical protein